MSNVHARSWWADVEHLREAAERRIAERERAQREGRVPAELTPLRAIDAVEHERHRDRFRRRSGETAAATAPRMVAAGGAIAPVEFDVAPAPAPPAGDDAPPRFRRASAPAVDPAPVVTDPERRETDRDRDHERRRRADREDGRTASRREELSRLAREQAVADHTARRRDAHAEPGPARRTVEIRGRVDVPDLTVSAPGVRRRAALAAVPDAEPPVARTTARRRPAPRMDERFASRPDRIALWAFLLGVFLIVVAAVS
jgi:hypothetical protein